MKFYNTIPKPIFRPISVTVEIETEEELENLKRIFSLETSLPMAVAKATIGTPEEVDRLKIWFRNFMKNFYDHLTD